MGDTKVLPETRAGVDKSAVDPIVSDDGLFPVDPVLRVVISSVLGVQKSKCTGCGLPLPMSYVWCPNIDSLNMSLNQCLVTDILDHLLEQIGQVAEPAAHHSINRRVHPKQSPSRRTTTSAPPPSPRSWSPHETSSRIPVPHTPLSPGKPERTTTSCAHNTTADARSNRALLPHTQQNKGSRNPSFRVALQFPLPRTRSGNWFVYVIYRFVVILQKKTVKPTSKQMMKQSRF